LIKEIRKEHPNVLVFDAGNTLWSNVPLSRKTKGKIIIEVMNAMGYTAAVLGEKDLLLGEATLKERFQEAKFPFLSANVLGTDGKLLARPYVVLELEGHRIAILGLTGQSLPQGITFQVLDPLEAAHKYLAKLRREADVIIVLAHIGKSKVKTLLESEEAIDLVIWGGAKPPLPQPLWDDEAKELALVAEVPSPGHAGRRLGVAKLEFDGEGHIIEYDWKSIALTPEYQDDPEILRVLQKYKQ